MSDPSLALQGAQVAALKGDAALTAIISGRVYDEPPDGAVYPYVVLGDVQVLDDSADCSKASEIYSEIDVWTQSVGYPEAKRIAGHIRRLLDREIPLAEGFTMLLGAHEQTLFMRDPNPKIRRARLRFHHLIAHP